MPGNVVDSSTTSWPARDHAGERLRGAEQRAEVGLAVAVQRRRDADEDRLGLVQVDGARRELDALERRAARRSDGMSSMCERPSRSPATLAGVDVDADHVLARLGERDRQREPDVAQADDSDAHARTRYLGRCVRRDLRERLGAHVGAVAVGGVPGHGGVERRRRGPSAAPSRAARAPAPRRAAAAGASPAAASAAPARTSSPPGQRSAHALDEPADRPRVAPPPGRSSTRVAASGVAGEQPLGDAQVALERAEHVLPRPHRVRRAQRHRLARERRAHAVGDAAGPAPSRRRRSRCRRARWRAAARAPRNAAADVLLGGLGGRVRVVAAERVVLAERRARRRRCGSTCRSSRRRRRAAPPRRAAPRAPSRCRSR